MSDPEYRDGAGRSRTAYRGRLLLLISLPVLVLGGSYFLFVEYLFARPESEFSEPLTALRIGGAAFIALAVVLALCCGFVALSQMSRPVRVLLRQSEEGSLSSEAGAFLYASDWDAFYLSKRLQGLQARSRSGAAAKQELESVSQSLAALKEEIHGTAGPGELPANARAGTVGRSAADLVAEITQTLQVHHEQLSQFFADLRTQTEILREEVEGLRSDSAPSLRIRPEPPHAHVEVDSPGGNGGADPGTGNGFHGAESTSHVGAAPTDEGPADEGHLALDEATERLRQLGVVLALEMERVDPDPAGLGLRYERFTEALEILESALTRVSSMKAQVEQVDTVDETEEAHLPAATAIRWNHLEESLGILEQRLDEVSDR